MVLGKKVAFLIGNGAEIRPLEMGRKGPGRTEQNASKIFILGSN